MIPYGAVLAGLGDEATHPELDWAARDAAARHAPLHVLRAIHPNEPTSPWTTDTDQMIRADLHARARTRVDRAVGLLRHRWPEIEVTGEVVDGIPWQVLVDLSDRALVTVLGSRRLGAFGSVMLGSVSTVVAAAAKSPVVVVRGPAGSTAEMADVVVGVDGGAETEDVLHFAFDHASRHHLPLRAICAWRPDPLAEASWRPSPAAPDRAERGLAELLTGWQEKYPDVPLRRGVVRNHATQALVDAGAASELLVVGSHSRHARLASLLGSVSQGVLHHATCPVAVVHPRHHIE